MSKGSSAVGGGPCDLPGGRFIGSLCPYPRPSGAHSLINQVSKCSQDAGRHSSSKIKQMKLWPAWDYLPWGRLAEGRTGNSWVASLRDVKGDFSALIFALVFRNTTFIPVSHVAGYKAWRCSDCRTTQSYTEQRAGAASQPGMKGS